MVGRNYFQATCVLAFVLSGALDGLRAQSWQEIADSEDWMHDVTVLTMAPDGAWGVATEPALNRAIAGAISNCRAKSGADLGCGAYFSTVRAGWSLGIRCGGENIIVAERVLADAERSASRREVDLRTNYVPDMPPCNRVVTVDPSGRIIAPTVDYSAKTLAT